MDWKHMFSKHKIDRVLVPRLDEKLAKLRSIRKETPVAESLAKQEFLQDRWIERT